MCSSCRPGPRTAGLNESQERQRLNLIENIARGVWTLSDHDHERISNALSEAKDWLTVAALHAELNRINPPAW